MDPLAFSFRLPRRHFIIDVGLGVAPGETVALIGPSGAGKTSILRVIAGLQRPTAGRITLGRDTWLDTQTRCAVKPEHRRVGYLPQDYGLLPHLTVERNVAFGARKRQPELLEGLGISHLAKARPAALSGGERQRVALARALAREPRVLLLDEPFAALDAITRTDVRDELARLLAELDLPTLVVAHAFDDAAALADRVAVLDNGRVLQLTTPSELLDQPANVTVARLTGMSILNGTATQNHHGRDITLDDGGRLKAADGPAGPVQVAVAPWNLKPATSGIEATITDVRRHGDRWLITTDRYTLELDANNAAPAPGTRLHASALPEHIHVFSTVAASPRRI
jgi:ABC-type sulfate/molybdate transport systems ATPase subunit